MPKEYKELVENMKFYYNRFHNRLLGLIIHLFSDFEIPLT